MARESFIKEFEAWKNGYDQHGRQAFARFVMLKFLESINEISDEFVFKGGNLLWHYIRTPRQTIDLDLTTINIKSHREVKSILKKTQNFYQEIEFQIAEFNEINEGEYLGASVLIKFETIQGQRNQFTIDVAYALPTDLAKIRSTISNKEYCTASIENIIADKLQTAHKLKSGNTRMKDFDDLWRISNSKISIKKRKIKKLINERNIKSRLELDWADYLSDAWKRHAKIYQDVPADIKEVLEHINSWLDKLEVK